MYVDIIILNDTGGNTDEFVHRNFKRIVNVVQINEAAKVVTAFFSSYSLDMTVVVQTMPL